MCTYQKFIRTTGDVNSYITALCAKRLVTQMLARGICFASDRTSVYTRCNEIITNVLRLTDLKRFILMITVVFKPLWRRIRVSYLRFVLAIQNRYARFDKWIPIIQIRGMKYNSLYSFLTYTVRTGKKRSLRVVLMLSSRNVFKINFVVFKVFNWNKIGKFNADLLS